MNYSGWMGLLCNVFSLVSGNKHENLEKSTLALWEHVNSKQAERWTSNLLTLRTFFFNLVLTVYMSRTCGRNRTWNKQRQQVGRRITNNLYWSYKCHNLKAKTTKFLTIKKSSKTTNENKSAAEIRTETWCDRKEKNRKQTRFKIIIINHNHHIWEEKNKIQHEPHQIYSGNKLLGPATVLS